MRIKVEPKGNGLHPSEIVVGVYTKEGTEYLAVSKDSVQDQTIEVGWPVGQNDDCYLVELPRETFTGFWRVWVAKRDVFRTEGALISA